MGGRGAEAGALTFLQRFGNALQLNPNIHSVVPDGVYVNPCLSQHRQSLQNHEGGEIGGPRASFGVREAFAPGHH
ncbi:transposase [Archangium violaceum]|uniref:transposase n=1 Tax=Archangium violaceum TaxID=83451 RepID=UPI00194E80FB|nr:transposase [Archangium violaceum]